MDVQAELGLYCVVDFEESPQIIASNWLSSNGQMAFWPPWAASVDQVKYDKMVKKRPPPEDDWEETLVLRMRTHGDNFQTVRDALTKAGDNSETDLGCSPKTKKRKIRKPKVLYDSSSENEGGETQTISPLSKENFAPSILKGMPVSAAKGKSSQTLGSDGIPKAPQLNLHGKFKSFAFATKPANAASQGDSLGLPTEQSGLVRNNYGSRSQGTSSPTTATVMSVVSPPSSAHDSRHSSSSVKSTQPPSTPLQELREYNQDDSFNRSSQPSIVVTTPETTPIASVSSTPARSINPTLLSNEEFQRVVLFNLKSIRTQVAELRSDFAKLKLRQGNVEIPLEDENESVLVGLPLVEQADLLAFNEKLKSSDFQSEVVTALKQIGGSSLGAVVRGILHRMISDSLAMDYSYQGGKGKKRFNELRLDKKIIFKTVWAHNKYANATDNEIRDFIAKWLANAKTRASSSSQRSKAVPATETPEDD